MHFILRCNQELMYIVKVYSLLPIFICIVTPCGTLMTFSILLYKCASYVPYRQLFNTEFGGTPTIYRPLS